MITGLSTKIFPLRNMPRWGFSLAVFLTLALGGWHAPSQAFACGPDTDCMIGERHYRVRMPDGHDGVTPVGAIFFMHGYRGTAAGIMRNKGLGKAVSDLGLALVAPKSAHGDWALPGSPSKKEPVELEYFDALIVDLQARFPIDVTNLMASGFSAGGMMVWNLACDRGDMFAAYAPISGTFWEPIPQSCATKPVNMIHTHGKTDRTVPLTGRPIRDTKQGSVPEVLDMYARHGGYQNARDYGDGDLECRELTNDAGKLLEICLHPRGHDMRARYLVRAWKKFAERGVVATN